MKKQSPQATFTWRRKFASFSQTNSLLKKRHALKKLSLLKKLIRDTAGAAAVELAVASPLLLILLTGVIESGHYLLLNLKLQHTVVSMADLTTRDEEITESTLQDIFLAVDQIITPFESGPNLRVYISAVSQLEDTPATIFWQRNGAGTLDVFSDIGVEGATPTLPMGLMLRDNEGVIIAEVHYRYEPLFFRVFEPTVLTRTAYFRPRLGSLQTIN